MLKLTVTLRVFFTIFKNSFPTVFTNAAILKVLGSLNVCDLGLKPLLNHKFKSCCKDLWNSAFHSSYYVKPTSHPLLYRLMFKTERQIFLGTLNETYQELLESTYSILTNILLFGEASFHKILVLMLYYVTLIKLKLYYVLVRLHVKSD